MSQDGDRFPVCRQLLNPPESNVIDVQHIPSTERKKMDFLEVNGIHRY